MIKTEYNLYGNVTYSYNVLIFCNEINPFTLWNIVTPPMSQYQITYFCVHSLMASSTRQNCWRPSPPNKTNLPDTNIDLLRWSGRSTNWFLSWIFILLQFRKAPSSTADPGSAVAIIASRLANCGWQVAETEVFLEEFPNGGGYVLSETMVLTKWLNFSCCKMCIHVYLSKCFNCISFLINKCIVNGNFSCFNYLNLQSCGHH